MSEALPPPTELAIAVIEKAIIDAYVAPDRGGHGVSAKAVGHIERREARLFCEATSGPWAEARRTWCGMAGLDPGYVERLIAERRAATGAPAEAPSPVPRKRVATGWAQSKAKATAARNLALAEGRKRYFTGEPCRNGHIAERMVRNWCCVDCTKNIKAASVARLNAEAA